MYVCDLLCCEFCDDLIFVACMNACAPSVLFTEHEGQRDVVSGDGGK